MRCIIIIGLDVSKYKTGGNKMQETKLFYTAAEVAAMLGISVGQSYKILRQWNEELQKKHYLKMLRNAKA